MAATTPPAAFCRESPARSGWYRASMVYLYVVVAALVGLAIYLRFAPEPLPVSREDGLIEWATCASFLLCSILAGLAAWLHRKSLTRRQIVFLLIVSLVSLLAVGEELSWGQRIWGFAPPETMRSGGGGVVQMGHNDVTLHNLSLEGPVKFSLGGMLFGVPLVLALGLYGIWLPLALPKGSQRARWLRDKLGLFVPPLHLGILMTIGAGAFHAKGFWPGIESRELKELLIPLVMAFVLLHAFFRGRSARDRRVTASCVVLLTAGLALSVYLAGR